MKSAYELAMERLKAQDPEGAVSLTDQQRASLSQIERKYKARIAEREIFLIKQLEEARLQGSYGEEEQILKQLASEQELINEEMNDAKDKIRKGEIR
jgi:hypothetical protein